MRFYNPSSVHADYYGEEAKKVKDNPLELKKVKEKFWKPFVLKFMEANGINSEEIKEAQIYKYVYDEMDENDEDGITIIIYYLNKEKKVFDLPFDKFENDNKELYKLYQYMRSFYPLYINQGTTLTIHF